MAAEDETQPAAVAQDVAAAVPASAADPDASAGGGQQAQEPAGVTEDVQVHIPMAERLTMISWGDGSAPSMPAVDDSSSDYSQDRSEAADLAASMTSSVRSSVYHYVEENGRTYHRYKEGKYALPNDEQEQARLDLQHAIFLFTTRGRLFLAPIKNPQRVLDFATGTGIWAVEFAQQFPEASVLGTDLSPIQPQFVPPNCRFEIDDVEDDWTYAHTFDYIHARAIVTCFRDPKSVLTSVYGALAPGGYFELQDGHFPLRCATPPPPGCALQRWMDLIMEASTRTGRPWTNTPNWKPWMEELGFEDVVEHHFYWPINPWPKGDYYKTLSMYVQEDLLNGLEGLSLKLLGLLGWKYDDIQALLKEVREDFQNPKITSYILVGVVWGRKPEAPAS